MRAMKALIVACCALALSAQDSSHHSPEPAMHTAIFAAGCFWGVEDAFAHTPGVADAVSGYIGGHLEKPTYRDVCGDDTGHAEAVRVTFDPSKVSFAQLLDVFWNIHDPTQVNRQGPDHGVQYRSAIFVVGPEQRRSAEASKAAAQAYFTKPIATQIVDAGTFWPAEDYHQDYMAKNGGSCHTRRQGLQVVTAKIELSDAEWKARLTPEQYRILRHAGTEAPFCEPYKALKDIKVGIFICAGCGLELFDAKQQFSSGTGWPSFTTALPGRTTEIRDEGHGMVRTEVRCYRCDGHLGHVFDDGPAPTGKRYCINGQALVPPKQ
jgi:peptide methionine sulfoxide reductase msrA/msrB